MALRSLSFALVRNQLPTCNAYDTTLVEFLPWVINMVLAKSKNAVGLGNSLMNDRFGKGKGSDRKKVSAGIHRTDQNGQTVSYYFVKSQVFV